MRLRGAVALLDFGAAGDLTSVGAVSGMMLVVADGEAFGGGILGTILVILYVVSVYDRRRRNKKK